MNDTPPTLADKLNAATSFRGASLAVVLGAVLTFLGTTQGEKIFNRFFPDQSIEQKEISQNLAMIREELSIIRWALLKQFGMSTEKEANK